jgi:hypothetical protein
MTNFTKPEPPAGKATVKSSQPPRCPASLAQKVVVTPKPACSTGNMPRGSPLPVIANGHETIPPLLVTMVTLFSAHLLFRI